MVEPDLFFKVCIGLPGLADGRAKSGQQDSGVLWSTWGFRAVLVVMIMVVVVIFRMVRCRGRVGVVRHGVWVWSSYAVKV